MPKVLTALATATILMASSGIIWKAEAAPMTHIGSLTPLTKSYAPTEKVSYYRRCYRRGLCGFGYPSYGYGYRPYGYYGYGYRHYGYGYRHYGYGYRRYGHYGYGYRRYGYGHRWRY